MLDKPDLNEVIEQHKKFIQNLNLKTTIITGTQQPRPVRGPNYPGIDYDNKGILFTDYTTNILPD